MCVQVVRNWVFRLSGGQVSDAKLFTQVPSYKGAEVVRKILGYEVPRFSGAQVLWCSEVQVPSLGIFGYLDARLFRYLISSFLSCSGSFFIKTTLTLEKHFFKVPM